MEAVLNSQLVKRLILFLAIIIIGSIAHAIQRTNCLPKTSIPVNGFLFGKPIETTVDNVLAKEMLTNEENPTVKDLFSAYENEPLNTETLADISNKYSMDVSTLYFLNRAYSIPQNKWAQDNYQKNFEQLKSDTNLQQHLSPLRDYHFTFIPGLDYLDKSNGGDFAKQRKLLSDHGIENELIHTGNWGFADSNATIIAKRLKELNAQYDKIILVSASKGGLDLAVALGKLLNETDVSSVKAWVSVGGILKGSPVADTFLKWPKRLIAHIGLLFKNQNITLVRDVSYRKRSVDFENFHFPKNIKTVHFIGAPLSTQIHKRIKSNYCSIREFGPNDGITPLADELTEGGIIVSELGIDHYYRHSEMNKKTIAVALTVVESMVESPIPAHDIPRGYQSSPSTSPLSPAPHIHQSHPFSN